MPESEARGFPAWAERERAGDLAWIRENLFLFWPVAQQGYADLGRGAILVDITLRPTRAGHPFTYVPQAIVEQHADEDSRRLVRDYDPPGEFVASLLKTHNRVSSYRVRVIPKEPRRRWRS